MNCDDATKAILVRLKKGKKMIKKSHQIKIDNDELERILYGKHVSFIHFVPDELIQSLCTCLGTDDDNQPADYIEASTSYLFNSTCLTSLLSRLRSLWLYNHFKKIL